MSTNAVWSDNSDRHTITAMQNWPTLECLPEPDLAPWPENWPTLECLPEPDLAPWPESFGGEPG